MMCFAIVGVLNSGYGKANSVDAQLITSLSETPQTKYYSVESYSNSIPELQSIISIEKKDVELSEVIKEIAKKSNLGFVLDLNNQALSNRINVHLVEVTSSDALQKVLKGSGYHAVVSSTRELMLIEDEVQTKKQKVAQAISGVVRDAATGETLPAVNIFVKGTNIGTNSDADGTFKLNVPDNAEFLVFRSIGYKLFEMPIVAGQANYEVELEPEVISFEDLVVVGYGTQQRSEITGSVTSIRTEEIQSVPVSSFENALQGRMAGVNVAESTGEPGAAPQILIRGTGSISAGNDPLYVIDGVPVTTSGSLQHRIGTQTNVNYEATRANPMSALNPNDIESIEVLKDASSAAIYGSRGSNGVILITTKRGQSGKPRVNFSAYSGVSTVFNKPDLMNSEELIAYTQDSRNNNYLQDIADGKIPANPNFNPATNAGRPQVGEPGYSANYLLPDSFVNWDGTDTDWLDLIFSTATMQNYDLSVSGGTDRSTYFFSAGYMGQEGVLKGSKFDRFSTILNVTHKLSDMVEIGTSLNASLMKHDRLPANSPYFGNPPGIIYSAMVYHPTVKPYNPDGSINQTEQPTLGGGMTDSSNPLAIMKYIEEKYNQNRIFGNTYGMINITKNLNFKSLVGYTVDNTDQSFYSGTDFLYRTQTVSNPFAQSGAGSSFNWLWENTLNYTQNFRNAHAVSAVVGYTAQKNTDRSKVIYANGFTDDQIKTVNGGIITGGNDLQEEWSIVSALARVNYAYKSKYLATATIRTDRSSRFGADKQTGIFPSFSVGWRLTEEAFMPAKDIFSELKLRASYGVTGNFEIPNYGSIGLLGEANYPFANGVNIGVSPFTLSNPDLTWETSYQVDFGLDYALFNDRIYGTFDYYSTTTKDLLLFVNIPGSTGFSTALTNIGEVENKGVEFSITTRNMVGKFQWATDFNIAKNNNKVVKLGPEGDPILSSGAAGNRHITMIGHEIGSYYGYVVDGIYQTQDEIDNNPVVDLMAPAPRPGDFRFKDINGDGVIDANDRTITGSYHPDFTYGITNRFSYNNFDMSIFLQGVQGREILNLTARHMMNGEANFNSYTALNDRWISASQPGNGEHPRADRNSNAHGNNNRESSYQVQDGSYLKIKNVTLGYTLPQDKFNKYFSRARLYVSASNLAIFTKYVGFNPEVSLQTNSLTPGEDYGAYPLSRTIQFGIDLSF